MKIIKFNIFLIGILYLNITMASEAKFYHDVYHAQLIAEAIKNKDTKPNLLTNLSLNIKKNEDKKKYIEFFHKIRKLKLPKIVSFLNLLQVLNDKEQVVFTVELNSESPGILVLNGFLKIKYDPDNIFKTLLPSSHKFSRLEFLIPKSYAAEQADILSMMLLLSATGGIDPNFNYDHKTSRDDPFSLRLENTSLFKNVKCSGTLKAKMTLTNYNTEIEELNDQIKIVPKYGIPSDGFFTLSVSKDTSKETKMFIAHCLQTIINYDLNSTRYKFNDKEYIEKYNKCLDKGYGLQKSTYLVQFCKKIYAKLHPKKNFSKRCLLVFP